MEPITIYSDDALLYGLLFAFMVAFSACGGAAALCGSSEKRLALLAGVIAALLLIAVITAIFAVLFGYAFGWIVSAPQ